MHLTQVPVAVLYFAVGLFTQSGMQRIALSRAAGISIEPESVAT